MERFEFAPPMPASTFPAEYDPNLLPRQQVDAAFDQLIGDLVAGQVEQAKQDFALWEQELQPDGVDQTSANIYPTYEDVTVPNFGETNPADSPEITYATSEYTPAPISGEVEVIDPQIDYETAEAETEDLIQEAAKPEPPLPAWPESNIDGTISEEGYSKRLDVRLGNVGQYLDAARDLIDNEADAEEWLRLKTAVYEAKTQLPLVGGNYDKVDATIDLEGAARGFLNRLGTV